jgi:uncharacterized membrane protein YphA (DoxX/SURF4 family)
MPHHRDRTEGFQDSTFMTRLNALQPLGLLLLRLALGIIFVLHGYPKLTHPNAMHGMFVQHGLPGYFVTVAGVLEVFGGGLIILGFLTRVAALLLAIEMLPVLHWLRLDLGAFRLIMRCMNQAQGGRVLENLKLNRSSVTSRF